MRARPGAVSAVVLVLLAGAAPPASASLQRVDRVDRDRATEDTPYGFAAGPCLAVDARGRAHVRVGDLARERRRGGVFGPSSFTQRGAVPCGVGWSSAGRLIAPYERELFYDYRDGATYEFGYELLAPGRDRGPRIVLAGEYSPYQPVFPPLPLVADAAGATFVPTDDARVQGGLDALIAAPGDTGASRRAIRWTPYRAWDPVSFAAGGSPRAGGAVLIDLERRRKGRPTLYRQVVVTRGRAGGFTTGRTVARGALRTGGVAVTDRGAVLALLQRPSPRIEIVAGRIGSEFRRRGPAIRGVRGELATDGSGALLAYETCPRAGACAVRARRIDARGSVGPPSRAIARVPRTTTVHVATGSGRALVWWRAGKRLQVAVRGPGGRFGRPSTVSSDARPGAKVAWGRGGELYAAWTGRHRQSAVALRVR